MVVPAGVAGALSVTAIARNALDVAGQDGPFRLNVVSTTAGDSIKPRVRSIASSPERLELKDSIQIVVTGQDNTQGSGVAVAGFTVLGIAPSRGDTLVRSGTRNFTPPRTGTINETFKFPTFNVDSLGLPDTLVYEVTGYLIDGQGNCAASIGGLDLVSLPCNKLATGEIVATGRSGQRLSRTVVSGRTVVLPNGGRIMDAAMDTLRRNLYLSNLDRDRVEVFRIQQERFLTPIPVGSEPWGLTMSRRRDTLIVANSGGTNISNVSLGAAAGTGPFRESTTRRLLIPDVILFEIERTVDGSGVLRYTTHFIADAVPPGFSDRPQFAAVDSTGRILYSTRTTLLGDFGTIRQAFVPVDSVTRLPIPGARPEVKLFFQHAALLPAPEFVAIGNVDRVEVTPGAGNDVVTIYDHVPGFPNDTLVSVTDLVEVAAADLRDQGSDIVYGSGRFSVAGLGFSDTTFVAASGDGGWGIFGEGSVDPVGRIIMYEASRDRISL